MKMLIDDLLEYIQPSTMICICIDNTDKLKRAAHLIDTINLLKDRRFWSDS